MTSAPSGYEGEGFPVRRAFAGVDLRDLDPFIHMDQMGEVEYAPGEPKGTPWHPHRGFETVTYIIDGVFDHHDSHGGGGTITNGDTQWMTAGSGLLHIETPPEWLVQKGGLFHGVQLWVNLPRDQKWPRRATRTCAPASSGCSPPTTPGVLVRVIAGDVGGHQGPGSTYTPMAMVHATVAPGPRSTCRGASTSTRSSTCSPATAPSGVEQRPLSTGQLAVLGRGDFVTRRGGAAPGRRGTPSSTCWSSAAARSASRSPGRGPFVMNTKAEVMQAFEDFQKGRMGQIPAVHGAPTELTEG